MPYSRPIALDEMKECIAAQGTELRPGDIVLVRTGFVGAVTRLSQEEQIQLASTGHVKAAGVKQGDDVLAWVWDSKFVSFWIRLASSLENADHCTPANVYRPPSEVTL